MEENKNTTTIKLLKDGPMMVKGNFTITGTDGQPIELTPAQQERGVALCRCGRSANKPFCDGSHAK